MPRLTDPWFEAEFLGRVTPQGGFYHLGTNIDGAQALGMWCPCGYGKPEYPLDGGRPHYLIVPFRNPRNAPPLPCPLTHDRNGKPTDWVMTGTGLHDLSLTPSVDVGGTPSCWHAFITNGNVG